MTNLNELDKKIKEVFPEECVLKSRESYSVFSGKNIPSFIKDWLIKKFIDEEGYVDREALLDFLEKFIPRKDTTAKIKGELISTKKSKKLLCRAIIEPDVRKEIMKFSVPDLEIKPNEGRVEMYLLDKNKELIGGEVWGIFTLTYVPPDGKEKGYIALTDYKPFKPYDIDLEYFREGRKEFTTEEWIDVLIKSMEYNPAGFHSLEQKLVFISRLLVFVEPRLNLIELAPKGTGKSYIFNNLSKYGWCISGGIVSRAKMFYDISKGTFGFIQKYDFVAMDEIQTIKFTDEEELRGALKNYLEAGKFTVANVSGTSQAGLILLGNIPLNEYFQPIKNNYFSELPQFFQDTALLDRFHGFIEGWKLPRIHEDLKVQGYTLNVEYFSEVLHYLRECPEYGSIVEELLDIPPKADTRDVNAIKKLCSAYLKLIFPNIKDVKDVNKREFEILCLNPAIEKRKIIRKQINLLDSEFKKDLPEIKLKN